MSSVSKVALITLTLAIATTSWGTGANAFVSLSTNTILSDSPTTPTPGVTNPSYETALEPLSSDTPKNTDSPPFKIQEVVLLLNSNLASVDGVITPIDKELNYVEPFIKDDTTLVPVRFLSETTEAEVLWDDSNKKVTLKRGLLVIDLTVGSKEALLNGSPVPLDVAPVLQQGKLYVPLRFLAESLGWTVSFDASLITLTYNQPSISALSAEPASSPNEVKGLLKEGYGFVVKSRGSELSRFATLDEAIVFSGANLNTQVFDRDGTNKYENFLPFRVYQDELALSSYNTYVEAVADAKQWAGGKVLYRNKAVWSDGKPSSYRIYDVPLILQNPELPRGCEVTSLAMMLNYAGVKADKMTLAKQVAKDPTPRKVVNGEIYYGNPNTGFVGDMYSLTTSGLGVFHKPIYDLATTYLDDRVYDMTGSSFDDVLQAVATGHPVWVVVTSTFDKVPDKYWSLWHTPTGDVYITQREHSILITGYDDDYIYINDPFGLTSKTPRQAFEEGWIQYGQQAISYTDS